MTTTLKADKWIYILAQLKNGQILTSIQKKNIATWSCINETIKEFHNLGILTSEQVGRTKEFKLTDKGKNLKKAAQKIIEVLG